MKAEVVGFFEKDTGTAQYVISDPHSKKAAILDAVLNYEPFSGSSSTKSADEILEYVHKNNLTVDWILETHAHADHISAAPYLQKSLKSGKIAIGADITAVQQVFKQAFNMTDLHTGIIGEGDVFHIGGIEVNVMHTPGHTPACICYYIKDDCVFVGDTIFMPDVGTARCDFPKGSAEDLWNSIQRLISLPEKTRMFLCHDYPTEGRVPAWETSIAETKAKNIHIKTGISKEAFIEMRTKRDSTLAAPRYLIPSIQVNVNAGFFPKPESNGKIYLKIPMNVLKPTKSTGVVLQSETASL